MVCGRGSGLGPSDWGGLLSGPGLSGVTELNGLAWSPDRRAVVQATLKRVARRQATPHVDLRCSLELSAQSPRCDVTQWADGRELCLGVREWALALEAVGGRVCIETVRVPA